jgi:hypothetical protein
MARAVEPEPVIPGGLKLADEPGGSPSTAKTVGPTSPEDAATPTVNDVPLPATRLVDVGVATIEKSGTTVKLAETDCCKGLLDPVIVSGYVPGVTPPPIPRLSVVAPLLVAMPGLNEAVTPAGKPATPKVTAEVNPPDIVRDTVVVAVHPTPPDNADGVAEREKLCTFRVVAVVRIVAPFVAVRVRE